MCRTAFGYAQRRFATGTTACVFAEEYAADAGPWVDVLDFEII